jgi:hypothetical protein
MAPPNRIVNPYLAKKSVTGRGPVGKPSVAKKETVKPHPPLKATAKAQVVPPAQAKTSDPKRAGTPAPLLSVSSKSVGTSDRRPTQSAHHQAMPAMAGPPSAPLSLKQKLKQDIEKLKRAKMIQKQKIVEQKRRKQEKMLIHRVEAAAQKHRPTQPTSDATRSRSFVATATPHLTPTSETTPPKSSSDGSGVATGMSAEITPPHTSTLTAKPPLRANDSRQGQAQPKDACTLPADVTPDKSSELPSFSADSTDTLEASTMAPTAEDSNVNPNDHVVSATMSQTKDPLQMEIPGTDMPKPMILDASTNTPTILMTEKKCLAESTSHRQTATLLAGATSRPGNMDCFDPKPFPTSPPAAAPACPSQLLKQDSVRPVSLSHSLSIPPYSSQTVHPTPDLAVYGSTVNNSMSWQSGSMMWQNAWYTYLCRGNPMAPAASQPYAYTQAHRNSFGFNYIYAPSTHHFRHPTDNTVVFRQQHQNTSTMPVPKPETPPKLATNVLESPSPFAQTHVLVPEPIVLLKQEATSSFGISMAVSSESALVEPEWLDRLRSIDTKSPSSATKPFSDDSNDPLPSETEQGVVSQPPVVPRRRRRRRRHVFPVMMVVDPSKQNQREDPSRTNTLRKGDIILSIGDRNTEGITFAEACRFFKSVDLRKNENGWYCATVRVARRRPPQPPKVPSAVLPAPLVARSVTAADLHRWAFFRMRALFNKNRLIGTVPSETDLQSALTQAGPPMLELSLHSLENAWQRLTAELRKRMNNKALQHWREKWLHETPLIRSDKDRTYLSDAQRSRMRASARPSNGCKCGSKTHSFVNDLACPLYSNIRSMDGGFAEAKSANIDSPTKAIKFQERKLKAVEAAFTERIVRARVEKEKEEAEAKFVDMAEEIQLRKLGLAVFSPSLTSMTLSCIAALKKDLESIRERKEKNPATKENSAESTTSSIQQLPNKLANSCAGDPAFNKRVDENDDDDDDDVPLEALAKRSLLRNDTEPSKKAKSESIFLDYECLAKILWYMSHRWGHVYREPSDVDCAWRWELFHGQMGTSNWETTAKNPRKQLSLENIRFILDDSTISNLQFDNEPTSPEQMEAMTILSFLTDPCRTGIVDELLSLQHSGVVRIDKFGVPRLSSTWFKNVDVLVLEEMMACWSVEADPLGRYGMHSTIRTLSTKWIPHDEGWALTSEPDDVVYEAAEFAAWREAFETKHEEKTDNVHGIGRFGI